MGDQRVQAFRKALNTWKRETFFGKLVQEVNSESIDRRIEEAHSMFKKLMTRLQEMEHQVKERTQEQRGGDAVVNRLVETLGPENTWTETLLDQTRSVLITDLYEYPLTFNSVLIDQFKDQGDFPIYQ